MWILSFLLLFALLILVLLFIVGVILFIIGKVQNKQKIANAGLKTVLIPIIITAIVLILHFSWEILASKPDEKELVGRYIATENESYELEFFADGTYTLSNIPEIDLCETGQYRFNSDDDQISFSCDGISNYAKIDRGLGSYKVKFIIGDPDAGQNVHFEKIEK